MNISDNAPYPRTRIGRNYTPVEPGALRPAGGRPADSGGFSEAFPAPVNPHRGSYTSPALAAASYPFVDLPPGNTLRCKLFPFSKFYTVLRRFFRYGQKNDILKEKFENTY
ncbi:MAG: hypothetical protein ACLU8C_11490 [Lacrimispora saccharolytica]